MRFKDAVLLLRDAGIDSPRYDTEEIFSRIGGYPRHLLSLDNPDLCDGCVISAIEKRARRVPLQYLIGEVGFYRELYKVTEDCLIPRADTEILVDYAVRNIPKGERVLDLCTGSGCVCISTVKNTFATTAIAVDISEGALSVARENAERNGVSDKITFARLDVMADVCEGEFYAVLSNPPYVTESEYEELLPEIYYEPKEAFVGGRDGLDFYRRITEIYKSKIKKGGFIAYEIGKDQATALKSIAEKADMSIEIIKDLSGLDRVAVLRGR